jgi:hypothetical protein
MNNVNKFLGKPLTKKVVITNSKVIELMSKYTIDLQKIINMKDTLIELKNMIGMSSVKQSIIKQIM